MEQTGRDEWPVAEISGGDIMGRQAMCGIARGTAVAWEMVAGGVGTEVQRAAQSHKNLLYLILKWHRGLTTLQRIL